VREAVGHAGSPRLENLERLAEITERQAGTSICCAGRAEIFDGDVQLMVTLKIAELARHRWRSRSRREYYQKVLELRSDDKQALIALESLTKSRDARSLLDAGRRAESARTTGTQAALVPTGALAGGV
jgi:hypothetical protein